MLLLRNEREKEEMKEEIGVELATSKVIIHWFFLHISFIINGF